VYSRQNAHFDRLIECGMSTEVVQVFRDIFANPNVELHHEGVITLTGSVVSPQMQASRWAVAQHNWDYNPDSSSAPSASSKMGYVVCKEADDMEGSGTTNRSDIDIYLPTAPGQDPNIIAGDVIMFFETPGGKFMAPGYGDLRVGTVRVDVNGEQESKGWAAMNGTLNGKDKGGSGIDLRDKFLRQWNTTSEAGNTGGSASGSLTIEGTISGTDIGNHNHTLSETTIGTGSESTVTVITGTPTGDSGIDLTNVAVTFTGSGGSGSPSASSIPPFAYVAFFERLDNSRTGLGR